MKGAEQILKALEVFKGETILYDSLTGDTVTFQDVIDFVKDKQSKRKFTNADRIAKLKKQVDDLKEENRELIAVCDNCPKVIADVEKAIKDTARELFEKIFEALCVFSTEGQSEEYNKGYIRALSDCDDRIQKVAKECGVEVE